MTGQTRSLAYACKSAYPGLIFAGFTVLIVAMTGAAWILIGIAGFAFAFAVSVKAHTSTRTKRHERILWLAGTLFCMGVLLGGVLYVTGIDVDGQPFEGTAIPGDLGETGGKINTAGNP